MGYIIGSHEGIRTERLTFLEILRLLYQLLNPNKWMKSQRFLKKTNRFVVLSLAHETLVRIRFMVGENGANII